MIKEHLTLFRRLMMGVDFILIMLAFLISYFLRTQIEQIEPINVYTAHIIGLGFVWVICLYIFDMYRSFRTLKGFDVLFIVGKATIFAFFVFGSYTYIFKIQHISRILVFLTYIIGMCFLSLEKMFMVEIFNIVRQKGYNFRSVLLIGTGKRAQHFIHLLEKHREWGMKIIGLVDEDVEKKGTEILGYRVIGSFLDIPDIIHNTVVDEVVFVVPRSWLTKIDGIIRFLEIEGIKINLAVDIFDMKFAKAKQSDLDGFPLMIFETTSEKFFQRVLKRIFDIFVSAVFMAVLSPLFLAIAVIIKYSSRGPVFFKQMRCSLYGRKFMMYKFRTMVEGAEKKLDALLQKNEMKGPAFKLENDPRLTPIGRFLRKYSLDELPQLWNVFKGDMSIVGPRPPLLTEVTQYDNWQRRRISMRPGLTCIWQVEGRNNISDFNEWARLDLEYIDNWSFWLDIKIMIKTIPVVLLGKGAK
jgi:exopolysaccharide biosynthesis polyprenyl glycosylphosphotransferase